MTSTEASAFSEQGLSRVREYVSGLGTTGLLVVVGGRVLLEYGDVQEVSYVASARKSVLAMLYGKYVRSGQIRLEASLRALGVDDIGGLTDQEKTATVADLLTARSGVFHPAANPGDDLDDAPPRGTRLHGTYFLYSNWDFNVLGTVFERATGRNVYDALQSDLATPLGMEDFDRTIQEKSGDVTKSLHLAYHMKLSTRDMARLGYLMLRNGRWGGRQLLPPDWVRAMTRVAVPSEEMHPPMLRRWGLSYGLLWWVFDDATSRTGGVFEGAYSAMGSLGQFVTIIPKLDMVVAHKVRLPRGRDVSVGQYRRLLELVSLAHCPVRAPSALSSTAD